MFKKNPHAHAQENVYKHVDYVDNFKIFLNICLLHTQKILADLYDVSCAHGDYQIT